MKTIKEYITESKKITYKDYSFEWIKIKDTNAPKFGPKMKYSLVCYPNDKTKDIIVFRDYAWYTSGYDQGHASSEKYYLNTIIGGERGNGKGQSKESDPYEGYFKNDLNDLYDYLTTGKTYSKYTTENLDKAKMIYSPKIKKSEIQKDLI